MFEIDDLCDLAQTYLPQDQVDEIRRAYEFGAIAHEGQLRRSGEPYIYHPLTVTYILCEMHMDHQTLIAALLHDVIEDTPTVKDKICQEFGNEVADIVDGVSKLTQMDFSSYAEAQAQNFRKMMMAMANDIRVILVKLADRLHNMRTMGSMPMEKRRLKARETLEIYVPIAQRLGMNKIRLELEELGFASLYPMRQKVLSEQVKKARGHRKEVVNKIKTSIKRRLRQDKLSGTLSGREKHMYSIYLKMRDKGLSFHEVYDVYAFRVIVDSVDMCYRILGSVHNLYKPVPGKFKDYIAIPKSNGYQSLHTILFGPYGVPIEVQIRTKDMNDVAEAGIAAHWLYKSEYSGSDSAHKRARDWLRGVLEMQRQAGDPEEFLEHVKVDLFPDEVYIFTPKGRIMVLPKNSTVIDLAYAVHTDIGDSCVAARVDKQLSPLSMRLKTGQTVEIITAPGAKPNPAWLNYVVTGKARSHIRHFLKNLQSDEAKTLGKRMLNRQLEAYSQSLEKLDPALVSKALEEFNLPDMDTLLIEIGLGQRIGSLVAKHLLGHVADANVNTIPMQTVDKHPLYIKGTEGMVVSFPKCCHPIPGDKILGYVSAGKGLVIHHHDCKNVGEYKDQPENWLDVEWEKDIEGEFSVGVRIEVINTRGALATIASTISDQGANIGNVEVKEQDNRYVIMNFIVTVEDRHHLATILRRIRAIKHVTHVGRTK